ncbi:hypothetical protein PFHG_05300 [Plasmodium falciparum HB3]|uniref:Plasmodium falciparum erythrocyte membrane protein 1 acidic terminal segment domain-containing protein n=1 Tax=Plasmodium falciparum (isolate HB3) TaxID=137071 RepID=A0A0L7KJM6_PLAFX|nr:hypothetical protein PFHG_05300 [Plasmodium falciparum HB3]
MCEKWENHHERLAKLKEEWENDTSTSGNTHPSDSNKTLNTDVSIQIHMDNPKPINEFSNMDTILEDLEKYNEPYYDVQDDIYYDVHDHDTSTVDSNNMDVPSKVQIEMDINTKLVKEKYPIADLKLFKLKNINYWKRIEYNNILLFVLLLLILLLIVILLEVVINSITINFISDNSTLKI